MANWLFPKEVLDVCRLAFSIVTSSDASVLVQLDTVTTFQLGGWEDRKMARPQPDKMHLVTHRHYFPAVNTFIDEVNVVRLEYAIVRHVVKWLDAHATMGAARYYFPALGALVPGLVAEEATGNHREPVGISPLLPLIRAASATVAASLMLPEQTEKSSVLNVLTANFGMFIQSPLTEAGLSVTVPSFSMYV